MASTQYDIVIVGAGPAGLSAARTAARLGFRTVVVDRLAAPGDLAHPCSAMVAPVPGFVSGQRADDGLRFPELDLLIPPALIAGYPGTQRLTSPSGYTYAAPFSAGQDFPVAVIDKAALLRQLAQDASCAGANLRYGTAAIGLLEEGGQCVGVRTGEGDLRADIVMSAEGTSRQLCDEAGLYHRARPGRHYAFVVSQELEAPAVRPGDLGQTVTLGRRYTSARDAFGTVVLSAPGRAIVHFTIFADGPHHHSDRSLWFYLDEYIHGDPRVSGYFEGARPISGSSHKLVLRDSPAQVVRSGFMGVGDAITPGGHLGILPAVYVGRQAALAAAEALDSGDLSANALAPYQELVQGPIMGSLDAEYRLILGLMRMTDDEIDRLCQTLHSLRLTAPFFGTWRTIAWEAVGWFVKQFPLVARDWDLLERILHEPQTPWLVPANARPGVPQNGMAALVH